MPVTPSPLSHIHIHTGGAVTISLDRHALDEASEGDQNLGTLDGFVSRLLQFEAFRELHLLCHIATTLTRTSDLHLVVSAVGLQEAELCHTMTHVSTMATYTT